MRRLAILGASVGFLVFAATSSSATPKKWYWTQSRAEALVVARVKLPFCRVDPSDPDCAPNGVPRPGHPNLIGFSLGEAQCSGSDELGSSFRYRRFSCRVITPYPPYFRATVAVYVTGAATFQWKLL
jgi:hypothetical protein